jgi:hypothetical protein
MNRSLLVLAIPAFSLGNSASSQAADSPDFSNATIIHFEVTGEIADKHVQIPPTDADLYADVTDKVTLSFDWDKSKSEFVGTPTFKNYPGSTGNLVGMGEECPTGSINGPYEHFDIVEVKPNGYGAIALVAKRIHPETSVAESCGAGRTTYKGGETPVTEYTAPPDPDIFAMAAVFTFPADSPIRISEDGKSVIMTAQNDNWVWTYTPSVKP